MGYSVDEAAIEKEMQEQQTNSKREQPKVEKSKAIIQTKEEQDALLAKMSAYAKRGSDDPEITAQGIDFSKPIDKQGDEEDDVKKEVLRFPADCYGCQTEGEVKMCIATIPFFKEIIIMAFSCDRCGMKSTEIKQGGGISPIATKIVFDCKSAEDLNRDVYKSDTCMLSVPEIDLELQPGTLGGVYTTVEGLIDKIRSHLSDTNPFGAGDSVTNEKFLAFLAKMDELKAGQRPFTLVLDDPLSNCFIYNPTAPADDPQIHVTTYERTWEQNEDLGINDMQV